MDELNEYEDQMKVAQSIQKTYDSFFEEEALFKMKGRYYLEWKEF